MPANRLSFEVTRAYRERLNQLHSTVAAQTTLAWRRVPRGDLDQGFEQWLTVTQATLTAAQSQAVAASSGYLTAYLTAELGEFTQSIPAEGRYAGLSRDGRPLGESLRSPIVAVLASLKRGDGITTALRKGEERALRMVALEIDHAARASLQEALVADPNVVAYQRAIRGTCGACVAASVGPQEPGEDFHVHPNCQCVSEPVVKGVADNFPRPTGREYFESLTEAEQDALIGPQFAEMVRSGQISLESLIARSPIKTGPDFITQASLKDIRPTPLLGTKMGEKVAVMHDGKLVPGTVARAPRDRMGDPRRVLNVGTAKKPVWVQSSGDDIFDRALLKKPKAAPKVGVGPGRRGFAERLTVAEDKALDSYKGLGYQRINGALRAGTAPGPAARSIDAAIRRGSLTSDKTLYRGFRLDRELDVGDTFQDLGFVSTSERETVARQFASQTATGGRRGGRGMIARIHTKAGEPAAFIPGQNEEEILLRRGLRFRVVRVKTEPSGIRIVDLEIVE